MKIFLVLCVLQMNVHQSEVCVLQLLKIKFKQQFRMVDISVVCNVIIDTTIMFTNTAWTTSSGLTITSQD